MKHKFDIKQVNKEHIERRKKILPPDETLKKLGMQEGDILADIGCGYGYFSLPAAKLVGQNGKVYALDIAQEMLDEVKNNIEKDKIDNIETIQVDEYDLKLKDGTITYGFISFVLHEIDSLYPYLSEVKRILTDKGKIGIIEWKKKITSHGPPIDERLDNEELIKILDNSGFKNLQHFDIGDNFYAIIGEKA